MAARGGSKRERLDPERQHELAEWLFEMGMAKLGLSDIEKLALTPDDLADRVLHEGAKAIAAEEQLLQGRIERRGLAALAFVSRHLFTGA